MIKKQILLLLLSFLFFNNTQGQSLYDNLSSYRASNGITYSPGSEIKLGRGSGNNGWFVYAYTSNLLAPGKLGPGNANAILTIKKIQRPKTKRNQTVRFVVDGGNIVNYHVDIENALATGEVVYKKAAEQSRIQKKDKFERLRDLRDALEEDLITQLEHDSIRTVILNGPEYINE